MFLVYAATVQDQLEKYGAYAGIAAFIGLAALTLLYFSQARELKRLRDWAGRAPERAAEMEARVVAAAESRRVQAVPVPKPQAPAQAPATPAASTAAGAAAAAGAGAGAAGAQAAVASPPGEAKEGEAGERRSEDDKAANGAQAQPSGGDGAKPPEQQAPPKPEQDGQQGSSAATQPASPQQPDQETQEADVLEDSASRPNGAPPQAPAVPRATPAPRPAAAPLRSTPAARRPAQPARRPAPPPRRQPEPEPQRSTARRLAPIAAVVAVLGIGVFAATQIFGGTETPPVPNVTPNDPAASVEPETGSGESSGTQSLSRAETQVSVFNGTTISGLAASTADKLKAAGFPAPLTGNNPDQQRSATLVLYASKEARRSAEEVSDLLKVSDPEAMDERTRAQAGPEADVVVIVGSDQTQ